jgi:phage head maturation protease
VARPRYVDPATLGPRQVAGYFAVWDNPRDACNEDGERYTETLRPSVFDDELETYGPDHPWPVHWDHSAPGIPDFDHVATVPIGRSLTIVRDAYGPFTIVELREGRLADETLAAARAGNLGFSYHGTDFSPQVEERDGRLYVTRHRMALREITLTGRPAEPGARVLAVGGPASLTRAAAHVDLDGLDDADFVAAVNHRVDAMFALTGHSRRAAELRAGQKRAARRRRTQEQATLVRDLAQCVVEGHRRAAALIAAAAVEAGRWPQDAHRPAAVITAEAVIEAAGARQAEEQLAELCQNDAGLIEDVMREAVS